MHKNKQTNHTWSELLQLFSYMKGLVITERTLPNKTFSTLWAAVRLLSGVNAQVMLKRPVVIKTLPTTWATVRLLSSVEQKHLISNMINFFFVLYLHTFSICLYLFFLWLGDVFSCCCFYCLNYLIFFIRKCAIDFLIWKNNCGKLKRKNIHS